VPPSASCGAGIRLLAALALGLGSGACFLLPIGALLLGRARTDTTQTILLVLAALVAVALVRRLGRLLLRMLDSTERSWRLPLLAAYGLTAMLVPAVFLRLVPALQV
jgi:hypothetical protein